MRAHLKKNRYSKRFLRFARSFGKSPGAAELSKRVKNRCLARNKGGGAVRAQRRIERAGIVIMELIGHIKIAPEDPIPTTSKILYNGFFMKNKRKRMIEIDRSDVCSRFRELKLSCQPNSMIRHFIAVKRRPEFAVISRREIAKMDYITIPFTEEACMANLDLKCSDHERNPEQCPIEQWKHQKRVRTLPPWRQTLVRVNKSHPVDNTENEAEPCTSSSPCSEPECAEPDVNSPHQGSLPDIYEDWEQDQLYLPDGYLESIQIDSVDEVDEGQSSDDAEKENDPSSSSNVEVALNENDDGVNDFSAKENAPEGNISPFTPQTMNCGKRPTAEINEHVEPLDAVTLTKRSKLSETGNSETGDSETADNTKKGSMVFTTDPMTNDNPKEIDVEKNPNCREEKNPENNTSSTRTPEPAVKFFSSFTIDSLLNTSTTNDQTSSNAAENDTVPFESANTSETRDGVVQNSPQNNVQDPSSSAGNEAEPSITSVESANTSETRNTDGVVQNSPQNNVQDPSSSAGNQNLANGNDKVSNEASSKANRSFSKGELICNANGPYRRSCNPNAMLVKNPWDLETLVATRDIEEGEEICLAADETAFCSFEAVECYEHREDISKCPLEQERIHFHCLSVEDQIKYIHRKA